MWRTAAGLLALLGIVYRAVQLGVWGFWNDEAWVAVSTRVEGPSQYLLAIATTPPLWTLQLLPLSWAPHPELSLRLVPFGWSVVGLWLAWRLGTRLAAHPLGGVLAVGLLAVDPASIQWAKQLKQYTAEAAMTLATLLAAFDVATSGRRAWWLVALLTLGMLVANTQLFVGLPVLAALGVAALARRDGPAVRQVVVAAIVVGVVQGAWYLLVIRPWFTPLVRAYFDGAYLPPADLATTLALLRRHFDFVLGPGLGPFALWIAGAALALLLGVPRTRVIGLALLLLVVEFVGLARGRIVPLAVARTSLYLTTPLLVACGAAVAVAVVGAWSRRALRPVAVTGLALVALLVLRGRAWDRMVIPERPEDLGPLIRRVETERMPGDRVLLYARSVFVWGYYQTPTPVLVPTPKRTVGWEPRIDDPDVVIIDGPSIESTIDRVLPTARRIWFVGSRFEGADEARIVAALRRRATIDETVPRARALLVRATPHSATEGAR
jgi:hypothetical protein